MAESSWTRWMTSSWKEQVISKQPIICLGCLNQKRYGSEITCPHLGELLADMKAEERTVKCARKVTWEDA